MEPLRDESPEWDKTTASIASLSSDDLQDSRPNRWRGHRSTWRTLTQDDRAVHDALQVRRNGDLAVHLYNAFALKGRRMRVGNQGELEDYEENEGRWIPPRGWTAWPLSLRDLPPDDFMPVQPLDEDSAFTYRKKQRVFPRSALAEEIEANILHLANAGFTARRWNEGNHGAGSAGEGVDAGTKNSASDDEDYEKPGSAADERSADSEMEDSDSESGDGADGQTPGSRIVPTADDDASSAMLKPAVGDIISKLEKTLEVLHNMMAATVQTTNDADEDEDEDEDGEETGLDEILRSRSRSRSKRPVKRTRSPSALEIDPGEMTPLPSPQKKPRHASAPLAPADGSFPSPASEPSSSPSPEQPQKRIRRRAVRPNRLAPRDWRATLGAASLAGFPPAAVRRAAQRCADLFGGGMELRVLNDHSPTRDTTVDIFPGGRIKLEEGEEDDGEAAEVTAMRLAARDASRANKPSRSPSRTARSRTASRSRRSQTPASSGSRSRSRSRSATSHLACPYRNCPRSVESFSRRGNLVRHVELMHGGDGAGVLGTEVDSEDEVEGGVHVDGFLRGIRVRRGWRGVDVREEKGREVERGRDRGGESGRERKGRRAKAEDEGYYYAGTLAEDQFH